MKKLINICDDSYSLSMFDNKTQKILDFLTAKNVQGLELIRWNKSEQTAIPYSKVYGVHLSFWPIWLDFWKQDSKELIRQFGNEKTYQGYYNAHCLDEFIDNYRKELIYADRIGAEYVVFHVSHVELEHCYTNNFTYSDEEVMTSFIEFLNEILKDIDIDVTILFENHWYPGLTFLNKDLTQRLLKGVNYKKLGFTLDIGHLMNTNLELTNEPEAVSYMMGVLQKLGDLALYIKAIHLNSSLTGEYVKKSSKIVGYSDEDSFKERLMKAMTHVGKIDTHIPFTHRSIKDLISFIDPDFLVYEFSATNIDELAKLVDMQNKVIDDISEEEATDYE